MSKRNFNKISNKKTDKIISIIIFLSAIIFIGMNRYFQAKSADNSQQSKFDNQNEITQSNLMAESLMQSNKDNTKENESSKQVSTNTEETAKQVSTNIVDNVDLNNGKLNVLFFYVGQADSTLIKFNNSVMLIDAGNNEDGNNVVNYLNSIGISKIDYLIGTHSDEDHIGGIDDVIKNIDIENFYIPTVGSNESDYKNAIQAAKDKNINTINPNQGDKFNLDNSNCEIMSVMNYDGISDNNSSIVIQLKYNDNSFLFMGDAEKEAETARSWNKIDVLKVGHHGSNTSSSADFLKQVNPQYAVIEVGKNNSYRLPNSKALSRIESVGAKILRTDTNCSSFWIASDGNNILETEVKINLDGNN